MKVWQILLWSNDNNKFLMFKKKCKEKTKIDEIVEK